MLSSNDDWADEATHQLLTQLAVSDPSSEPRSKALELLAGNKEWADEATRQLLTQCARNDSELDVNIRALQLLSKDRKWVTHKETLALKERTKEWIHTAQKPEIRGQAACYYFKYIKISDPLSSIKTLVFSQDIDGFHPYIDPFEPLTEEHIAAIGRRANLSDEKLNKMIEQISTTLGWNVRNGR